MAAVLKHPKKAMASCGEVEHIRVLGASHDPNGAVSSMPKGVLSEQTVSFKFAGTKMQDGRGNLPWQVNNYNIYSACYFLFFLTLCESK